MNNTLKIVGALVVFGLTIMSGIISIPYNLISGAIAASLFYFFDPIFSLIEDYKKRTKDISRIKRNLISLDNFLKKYTYLRLDSDISFAKRLYDSVGENLSQESILQKILNKEINLKDNEKDCILILFLIDCINKEKNEFKKTFIYKETISQIIEKYDFNDSNFIQTISSYYFNYLQHKKLNSPTSINDYYNVFSKLTNKYCKSQFLAYKLKFDKDQIEELRRTLSILYTKGKLNLKQLGKELLSDINSHLEKEMKRSKIFLLMANNHQRIKKIDELFNKIPNLRCGKIYPNKLPMGLGYLHMRILYPPERYESAEKFLAEKIYPLIPKDKLGEGYISIIPIEGKEISSIPKKIEDITDENVKKSYSALRSIKTGNTLDINSLILNNIQINEEKDIKDLLHLLPFNIFFPNLDIAIKNFIISNYECLKKEFKINELTDWADVDSKRLKEKLIKLDKKRKKIRLYSEKEWENFSERIKEESKKHKKAILGIVN